jgi:hypothetical protein
MDCALQTHLSLPIQDSQRALGTATTTKPGESAIRRNDDLSRGDAPRTSHLHDEAMIGD